MSYTYQMMQKFIVAIDSHISYVWRNIDISLTYSYLQTKTVPIWAYAISLSLHFQAQKFDEMFKSDSMCLINVKVTTIPTSSFSWQQIDQIPQLLKHY